MLIEFETKEIKAKKILQNMTQEEKDWRLEGCFFPNPESKNIEREKLLLDGIIRRGY